jgi:glutathione S-transferase
MSEPITVIGSYILRYVRMVLVFLELKFVDYRIDPMPPFVGNDELPGSVRCGVFRCCVMAI